MFKKIICKCMVYVKQECPKGPEEKGQSGAICRGPRMLYIKYQGSKIFFKEDFPYITLYKSDLPPGTVPIFY